VNDNYNGAILAGLSRAFDFMARRPLLLAALVAIAYGIRLNDTRELVDAAVDPYRMVLPPEREFLYGSPLPLFLVSYFIHQGLPGLAAYIWVQVVGAGLFLVGLHRALGRGVSRERRNLTLTVLLASPLLVTLLWWFGKSDLYLLGFYLLLASSPSTASQVGLAVLMIVSHGELATVLLLIHGLLTPSRWRPIALGLVVGHAILAGYTGMLSPQPTSRADFAWQHATELIGIFAATPLLHLFVPATLTVIYATMRILSWRAVTVLAVALAFAIVAQDFTRVFTIISTPLLIDAARTIAVNRPSAVTWLWPLALIQLHLAGTNLLWVHGRDIRIGP
jgi:hypothetical protein